MRQSLCFRIALNCVNIEAMQTRSYVGGGIDLHSGPPSDLLCRVFAFPPSPHSLRYMIMNGNGHGDYCPLRALEL
jgi:hypothetical protein